MSPRKKHWTITKEQSITLTPSKAREFLELNTFQNQRLLRNDHVKFLRDRIREGLFTKADIALCEFGSNVWLLNGQHACTAVSSAGMDVRAHVVTYEVTSKENAWKLFGQFDQQKKRTLADVIHAARFDLDQIDSSAGLSILTRLASALDAVSNMREIQFGQGRRLNDKARLVDLLKANQKEALFALQFKPESKFFRHLRKVGVFAAMIATYRKRPRAAQEFWHGVASGEGLVAGEPAYALWQWLHAIDREALKMSGKEQSRFCYSTCVQWFNAHYKGEPRKQARYISDKPLPKVA